MGHNVVFITAEILAQKLLKRIGANLLEGLMSGSSQIQLFKTKNKR